MSGSCVLDTDVLIGVLDRADAHHERAAALVLALGDARATLAMSVVNYAEALVRPAASTATLTAADRAITALGIELVAPDRAIGRDAARLRRGISLADGFALATARAIGASVATFDERVLAALPEAGLAAATA